MTEAMKTGLSSMLEKFTALKEQISQEAAQQSEDLNKAAEFSERMGAVAEAAYVVAASDGGGATADEIEHLAHAMATLTGDAVDASGVQNYIDIATGKLSDEGQHARIAAVAGALQDADLRRAALTIASGIAYLDGGIGTKQGLALQELAKAFGFSIDELHKIMGEAAQKMR